MVLLSDERFVVITVILGIVLLAAAWLERHLVSHMYPEILALILITTVSYILLGGIEKERKWAWPFASIIFALLLANNTFVWWQLRAIGATTIAAVFSIFGMMVAFVSLPEKTNLRPAVETYTTEPVQQPGPLANAQKPRRGRPPKLVL